mmetsp:Transcript_9923/g.18079  ORF Transcript_9923/g.18079 Transcript_9923/m.18079 type:complete len:327 (-) Transcript_9923:128-1108(-)|eukprot:CAMPEP_0197523278 /NCGR_PEP_ID=MMETSP1318-20131121/8252_1 /TAXON_ID=552666 /ORGANISM="Partenskyella glossopodia, Strain RCC365" /LENGTH=326 /DNA_ID=CAMNT_0043075923 /DNA_START=73 /DNA_END=1053 /DNA_ORIENTATION=-
MEEYEKTVSVQIMHLFAPLKRSTKDSVIEDLSKMRERGESVGCLPTVYLTELPTEISLQIQALKNENKALRAQLLSKGINPTVEETQLPKNINNIANTAQQNHAQHQDPDKRGYKLKKISSFRNLMEIKTPHLGASAPPRRDLPPLDAKGLPQTVHRPPKQTVEIEVVKHLQQGTGLLKKMKWSGPKVRVFKVSRDMMQLERESLNLVSFEPTQIHLRYITAMENRTESTTDPKLAEAGFCIYYDTTGRRQRNRWFDVVAPTAADYILWTKGLQLVLETLAKSENTGARLQAELKNLTIEIPVTMINHWYVQHFPEGCMDDGEESL